MLCGRGTGGAEGTKKKEHRRSKEHSVLLSTREPRVLCTRLRTDTTVSNNSAVRTTYLLLFISYMAIYIAKNRREIRLQRP